MEPEIPRTRERDGKHQVHVGYSVWNHEIATEYDHSIWVELRLDKYGHLCYYDDNNNKTAPEILKKIHSYFVQGFAIEKDRRPIIAKFLMDQGKLDTGELQEWEATVKAAKVSRKKASTTDTVEKLDEQLQDLEKQIQEQQKLKQEMSEDVQRLKNDVDAARNCENVDLLDMMAKESALKFNTFPELITTAQKVLQLLQQAKKTSTDPHKVFMRAMEDAEKRHMDYLEKYDGEIPFETQWAEYRNRFNSIVNTQQVGAKILQSLKDEKHDMDQGSPFSNAGADSGSGSD